MQLVVRGLMVTLLATAGCGPLVADGAARPSPADVRVALLTPLSGPDAAVGSEQSRGAELATEIVNGVHPDIALPLGPGAGLTRLGGARLSLTVGDTAGDPGMGADKADLLVSRIHPVAFVVGDRDPVAAAVSLRAEQHRLPLVDATSSAGSLTDRGLDWYFRVAPSDRILGGALFGLIAAEGRHGVAARRIAVVEPADGRYEELAAAVGDLAVEAGVEVVAPVRYAALTGGLTAAVRAAAAARPDVTVAVAGTPTEAAALVRGLAARAPRTPLVGLGPGFAGPEFPAAAGSAGEGVLRAEPWSMEFAQRNDVARAVAALYERRFGMPMTRAAASAFTAVMTLAAAIDAGRATTSEGVRSALVAADLPGSALVMPWSGVRFERGGQNSRAAGVVEQVLGGRPRVVYPAELASDAPRWPARRR